MDAVVRVETTVLDPGAFGDIPYWHGCGLTSGNGLAMTAMPHVWQILSLEGGATWMCTQCRRIEKRVVVPTEGQQA